MTERKYNPNLWTYGVELEFSDVYCFNKLPDGASWNTKDYSIVNSNGIANDPSGELYQYGGEINTKPTSTIEEQVQHIKDIINMLNPKPVNNYKCNLHIHIRVPGLKDDLEALKRVMKYIHDYGEEAFEIVDPLIIPTDIIYSDLKELKAAKKRYIRNKLHSHHGMVYEETYERIMNSKTPREFYEAHANSNNGHSIFPSRTGINMRQLFDAPVDTIEFRHFFGTLDMLEYKSCLTWCSEFLNAALNTGETPKDIIKRNQWMVFPKEKRFELRLQNGFERTTPHDNKFAKNKEEIKKNIEMILRQYNESSCGEFSKIEIDNLKAKYAKPNKTSLFD